MEFTVYMRLLLSRGISIRNLLCNETPQCKHVIKLRTNFNKRCRTLDATVPLNLSRYRLLIFLDLTLSGWGFALQPLNHMQVYFVSGSHQFYRRFVNLLKQNGRKGWDRNHRIAVKYMEYSLGDNICIVCWFKGRE